MTELFPSDLVPGSRSYRVTRSIGWPVPGVEIRVVDDAGRGVVAGEAGELWIRSPSAMDAYINAPDETREVLVEGWFRTGDLATVSDDGLDHDRRAQRDGSCAALFGLPARSRGGTSSRTRRSPKRRSSVYPHPELGEDVAARPLRPDSAATPMSSSPLSGSAGAFKYPRRLIVLDRAAQIPAGKILKSKLTPRP